MVRANRYAFFRGKKDSSKAALQKRIESIASRMAKGKWQKSSFAGTLAACALVSPCLQKNNAETLVVASSFKQGCLIFNQALAYIEQYLGYRLKSRRDLWTVHLSSFQAEVTNKETGSKLRVLSSDPLRSAGVAYNLCLADEGSSWPNATSDKMYSSLRMGVGKIQDARFIACSTLPDAAQPHWFTSLAKGVGGHFAMNFTPSPQENLDVHSVAVMKEANPSWGYFKELRDAVKSDSELALQDPMLLQGYKALRLNLGCADVEVGYVFSPDAWKSFEGDVPPVGDCIWGLDMGTVASMSAVAGYWPESHRLDALGFFPGVPAIEKREQKDSQRGIYQAMIKRKELILAAGSEVVPVNMVLSEARDRFGGEPAAICCDRWRIGEVKQGLREAGMSARIVERGMGFRDGGEDLRLLRTAALQHRVVTQQSLLLRHAFSAAVTLRDPAGGEKMSKRRQNARQDPAIASMLAVAEGERRKSQPVYESEDLWG